MRRIDKKRTEERQLWRYYLHIFLIGYSRGIHCSLDTLESQLRNNVGSVSVELIVREKNLSKHRYHNEC